MAIKRFLERAGHSVFRPQRDATAEVTMVLTAMTAEASMEPDRAMITADTRPPKTGMAVMYCARTARDML